MSSCPQCRSMKSSVVDSREKVRFGVHLTVRRRQCPCGVRFTTFELNEKLVDRVDKLVELADFMGRVFPTQHKAAMMAVHGHPKTYTKQVTPGVTRADQKEE